MDDPDLLEVWEKESRVPDHTMCRDYRVTKPDKSIEQQECKNLKKPGVIESTASIMADNIDVLKELEQEVLTGDHEYMDKNGDDNHAIDNFLLQMRRQESDLHESLASKSSQVPSSYELDQSTAMI
jgi:hypothetical protein